MMAKPDGIDVLFIVMEAMLLVLVGMDVMAHDWPGAVGTAGLLLIILNLHNVVSR